MEVFDIAHERSYLFSKYTYGGRKKPGEVVFDLPQEMREVLKNLKSDDIKNIRPDYIFGDIVNGK